MATKYYLLTDYDTPIGVIKIENGVFDIDKLKSIIEEYTEISITNVNIEIFSGTDCFEINYLEEETGEENFVSGEPVDLLF